MMWLSAMAPNYGVWNSARSHEDPAGSYFLSPSPQNYSLRVYPV
jgi:hypothetical protein